MLFFSNIESVITNLIFGQRLISLIQLALNTKKKEDNMRTTMDSVGTSMDSVVNISEN